MVWRLIKAVLVLTILAALGLIAYAYIGPIFFAEDFAPPVEQVTKPVTLEVEER
jgi:O-antigen/teichoic acid export membrane protein